MANSALYSTGVVAVLETKLLKKEKFNAMVETESLENCLKTLYETGFADGKIADASGDFDLLLQVEGDKNVSVLQDLSADQHTTDALLLRYDYHNLKTLLKAQSLNMPFSQVKDTLYKGGLTDINVLEVEVVTGGERLRPLMQEVISKVSGSQNPKSIDVTCDIAMYTDIKNVLQKSSSKVVTQYFAQLFDFVNISTFIRNKIANINSFADQLIEGGYISTELFSTLMEKPLEQFFKVLKEEEYKQAAEIAEQSLNSHRNLLGYELFYKNFLFEKIWESRNNMHGVEPLIYYFFAKEAEIDNIRLILTCKKNKVDKRMIYQRLRDTYA